MKIYALHQQQVLPISLDEAWAFFSTPKNLDAITPPWMRFTPTRSSPVLALAHTEYVRRTSSPSMKARMVTC